MPLTATTRPCPICGTPVHNDYRRGRPAIYCSDDCLQFSKLLSRIESYAEKIIAKAPRDEAGNVTEIGRVALQRIRGQLWRIGNLFNFAGPMARIPDRKRKPKITGPGQD